MTTLLRLGQTESVEQRVSPDWVRISYASALALGFKSGRFTHDFDFGGINLLLNYTDGCRSDCGYCGLARSRAGIYEEKSFIRVEWPLVETDELISRMSRREDRLTRLCISMVTHGHAYPDTLDITERIRQRVRAPLSILVAPPTLNEDRLRNLKRAGADMIGIGLDAVTEDRFRSIRGDVPRGGLSWEQYWEIVSLAREIYGPWKVNCHTLVGLGETDRDLIELFDRLLGRQVFSYLFCFNPEPDSRMAQHPKSSVTRWRRVQLVKFLLEETGLAPDAFGFDGDGALSSIGAPADLIDRVVSQGHAFMTNGCTGTGGEPGCTRPMGSWRPTEPPRDFPWLPGEAERHAIVEQLRLGEILRPGPASVRARELCAPPAAGRVPTAPAVRR